MSIFDKVTVRDDLFVVIKSDKIGTYLFDTRQIVFKETVVDSCDKRYHLEDQIHHNERNQEDITPLVITYDLTLLFRRVSHKAFPPSPLSLIELPRTPLVRESLSDIHTPYELQLNPSDDRPADFHKESACLQKAGAS